MLRKRSSLLRLLAGLSVLLLVSVSLTVIPSLRQIGRGSIEEAISRLQRGREANIEVTSAPFPLPDYMWDIAVKDGQTADLRPFVPSVATLVPGILNESGIRIYVGQTDSLYNLRLQWDTGISDTQLELTLFDYLKRPVGYSKGFIGNTEVMLSGGLYKLALSSEGLLGEDFKLTAQVARITKRPKSDVPSIGDIPTIDIHMSEAMFQSWDVQRAAFSEAIKSPTDVVDTSNYKRVLADLVAEGERSTVQLWAAGWGDPVHFSQDTPSFTGRIVSGPLLFGMSRFKLYSIRAMAGLLDYVVGSIMDDEGIFARHNLLVRISLNSNNLGLYLLEETTQSRGLFAAMQRYDGQVTHKGVIYTNPTLPIGLVKLQPIGADEESSQGFASRVNQLAFAKTLAFLSRFQATHATQGRDIQFYRHPYLDSPEPLVRDLNVTLHTTTWPGLLIHTSWWLGWHPIGMGATFNPKTFPPDEPLSWSTQTPYAFFFGTTHPAVNQFVSTPENRELFDRYLLYASDQAFQQRFAARMQTAFEAALPFLSTDKLPVLPGGGQPYRGFDSELSWISHQADVAVSGQLITPRTIPVLLERSALLINIDPSQLASTIAPESRLVSLYNLSPFSARLRLPDYAHIADSSMTTAQAKDAGGWYLSPSLLFPTIVPLAIAEPQEDLNLYPLTQDAAQRFLNLERLRFRSQDATTTLVPFVDVQIPANRFNDFLSTLEVSSMATLGGTYTLPADRNILVRELPVLLTTASQTGESPEADLAPDVVILPLSLEQIENRHRLSLLISNFSNRDVPLDLANLRWPGWPHSVPGDGDIGDANDVPYSIHSIWKLSEKPVQIESSRVTLGAASSRPDSSRQWLGSPMIWTGALEGLLDGPADDSMSNSVLAEFDLTENGTRWMQTNANGLARSASSDGVPRKVIVQEPYQVYLPIEPPEISLIYGYQSLPTSATLSVSSFLEPHTKDLLIDGNVDEFWHVENPPKSPVHWIEFDFDGPVTVQGLAILPRKGIFSQFWDQDHAIFQGSNDVDNESSWIPLAKLFVDRSALGSKGWNWLRYTLPNTTAYRYYRILIDDPSFLSIAEIKFRTKEWEQSVAPVQLTIAELLEQGVLEVDISLSGAPEIVRLKNKDTVISGLVTIPPGYVLELEPGSILKFTNGAGILSYSPIKAVGTAQEPIILSPAEGNKDWLGVAVVNASGTSEFRHVQMSQAIGGSMGEVQFSGGLTFMETSVIIADTGLSDFDSEDGLHLSNASFEITGLTITGSKSDALDSDWSYGTIADSTFSQNGGDGVDLSASRVTISNSIMEDCGDKGISVGEGSVTDITRVSLIGNRTGIAVKDQSIVSFVDSEVAENDYGLLRYIKKPIYIYPELTMENNIFRNNQTNIHEESPTSWTRRFD